MTILLIEDDQRLSDLIRLSYPAHDWVTAPTLGEAQSHLAICRPHLIILDLGLPDSKGLETLKALEGCPTPKVVLTACVNGAKGAWAMGAADYIIKNSDLERVLARVGFNLARFAPKKRRQFEPEVFAQIQAHLQPIGA